GKILQTLMFLIFVNMMKSSDEACIDADCVCNGDPLQELSTVSCKSEDISLIHSALKSSSEQISDSNYDIIEINNEVVKTVPAHFLGNIDIGYVRLILPSVDTIDDDAFSGQAAKIKVLSILGTSLPKIPIGAVKNLQKLTELAIENAYIIVDIEETCFHPLSSSTIKSLQSFTLINSNLRYIGRKAFTTLKSLTTLILKGTQLDYFPSDVLPNNRLTLMIGENNFKNLQRNVLNDLSESSKIFYGNNKISSTSSDDWKLIIKKHFVVYLHGNPIDCNCQLIPLVKLSESKKKEIVKTFTYGDKEYSGLCQTPAYLKDKKISSLTEEDLASQNCEN
ncbi:Uncharacterised protein at_DN1863, partial [Pycnogonum litorale]